jgi:methylenetetrahydrofolate reductase (NADPH)
MVKNMRDKKIFACGDEIRNSKKAEPKEPRMFIGAAANPFADPFDFRAVRLEKKIVAGADFVQTQCIFDMERFDKWMEQARNRGLHERSKILAGVMPFKSVGAAVHMRDKVAGAIVPNSYVERMAAAADPKAEGIKICVEQIQRLREIKGIAGIHIMAVEWEEKVAEIVEKAGLKRKPAQEEGQP